MEHHRPAYIDAWQTGLLQERLEAGRRALAHCRLCPRRCGVDRRKDDTGFCRTGRRALVSSFNAHFGEESPLVGRNGSGTIFFTHCNLLCIFCQNYDISHTGDGEPATADDLAAIMLTLQKNGCHNVNLVTPSHVVPQILEALAIAVEHGLQIPLVFNTGGYDRVSTLKLLDGIVDIYMPDFKFWHEDVARQICDAPDYPRVARRAVAEMHRQVGDLIEDADGLARRGLIVRHLVMPGGLAGSDEIMAHIADQVSMDTYVNIMSQYRPCGRAGEMDALRRPVTGEEFRSAADAARRAGLTRLDRPGRRFLRT